MRRRLSSIYVGIVFCCLLLEGCNRNPLQLAQVFDSTEDGSWSWNQAISQTFEVKEAGAKAKVTLQIRHGNRYAYENLYVLLKLKQPDGKVLSLRASLQLADDNGQWLGKSVGGTFAYRTTLNPVWVFQKPGTYSLSLDQNMRDNPLLGVEDAGFEVVLVK